MKSTDTRSDGTMDLTETGWEDVYLNQRSSVTLILRLWVP